MHLFTMPGDAQLLHFPSHPAAAIAQLLALKTINFDNHSHMALPDASFHFSWRPGQSWIFESNGLAHCTGQSSLNADIKTTYQSMPPSEGCLLCIEITETNEMVLRSFLYSGVFAEQHQSWQWLHVLARLHGGELWGVLSFLE